MIQRRVAVGRIIEEIGWDAVPIRELLLHVAIGVRSAVEVLAVTLSIRSGGDEKFVVLVARGFINFCRSVIGQWTCPKVVSISEAQGGQFQLLVRTDSAHPQGTCVKGAHSTTFWHFVSSLASGTVLPHGTACLNQSTDIVPLQVTQGSGGCASCSARLRLRSHLIVLVIGTWSIRSYILIGPSGRTQKSGGEENCKSHRVIGSQFQ